MSIERATLSDFTTPQRTAADRRADRRDIILQEGGVYGRHASTTTTEDQPEQECLHCGRAVPSTTARVIGDNNGCVPACDGCWTSAGGEDYRGVVTAVRHYRAGDGFRKSNGGETDE